LRDLSQYDALMEGLMKESTKLIMWFFSLKAQYQSEARKLAMKDAKLKAEDYVSVLAKVQSCNYYRQFTKLSTTAFMQG
jgi:uncharacterized protein YggE